MKSEAVLILGKGYLGHRLHEEIPSVLSGARVTSLADALKLLETHKPKVLVNCVGFTGCHNVDDCEREPEKTLLANTFVPIYLAEAAMRCGVKLVHISSGCMYHYDYDKSRPVSEAQDPDYLDLYYSRSKIYSERALEILSRQFNILITRIRIPLDNRSHPKNILNKLLAYGKVIDVPNSVTYIPDFIAALKHLIRIDARGVFNVVAKGPLRYPQLMKLYQKYVPDFQYQLVPYNKLNLKRTNLVMSCRKLEHSGFKVRSARAVMAESIKGYLKDVSQV